MAVAKAYLRKDISSIGLPGGLSALMKKMNWLSGSTRKCLKKSRVKALW